MSEPQQLEAANVGVRTLTPTYEMEFFDTKAQNTAAVPPDDGEKHTTYPDASKIIFALPNTVNYDDWSVHKWIFV